MTTVLSHRESGQPPRSTMTDFRSECTYLHERIEEIEKRLNSTEKALCSCPEEGLKPLIHIRVSRIFSSTLFSWGLGKKRLLSIYYPIIPLFALIYRWRKPYCRICNCSSSCWSVGKWSNADEDMMLKYPFSVAKVGLASTSFMNFASCYCNLTIKKRVNNSQLGWLLIDWTRTPITLHWHWRRISFPNLNRIHLDSFLIKCCFTAVLNFTPDSRSCVSYPYGRSWCMNSSVTCTSWLDEQKVTLQFSGFIVYGGDLNP